ncbi:hypothetical protein A5637_20665 [Mycolicibacterium fortuitum]|uniref:hypothetical protein n=1 Tax=Mycolicibacterium fortuitum TaxID=1766 RepID=UPI0007EC9529|nr:hypothetical protein [Mycolicibacterium fortuitum]OBK12969.1 hypothetical protein A5637_20665 [Mycolicibacterium fortuitum]
MSGQQLKALCCTCGSVRTCRRPRNYRPENYWLRGPVDRDWHRETGDLKCESCERVTTHAIITGSDHAESLREVATGWHYKNLTEADRKRIIQAWRHGTPQNPQKRHLWWTSDLQKAREAGKSTFPAICKTEIPVPKIQSEKGNKSYAHDELIAPNRFHDVEYEDESTGLWWYEVDCTDCLFRSNAMALEDQRKTLKAKMQEIVNKIDGLDARTVADLLANFAADEGCDA